MGLGDDKRVAVGYSVPSDRERLAHTGIHTGIHTGTWVHGQSLKHIRICSFGVRFCSGRAGVDHPACKSPVLDLAAAKLRDGVISHEEYEHIISIIHPEVDTQALEPQSPTNTTYTFQQKIKEQAWCHFLKSTPRSVAAGRQGHACCESRSRSSTPPPHYSYHASLPNGKAHHTPPPDATNELDTNYDGHRRSSAGSGPPARPMCLNSARRNCDSFE